MLRLTEAFDSKAVLHPIKRREQYIGSVINVMKNVLNTSQGSASIDLHFGMPFFDIHGTIHEPSEQEKLLRYIEHHLQSVDKRIEQIQCAIAGKTQITDVMSFSMSFTLRGEVSGSALVNLMADGTFEVNIQ